MRRTRYPSSKYNPASKPIAVHGGKQLSLPFIKKKGLQDVVALLHYDKKTGIISSDKLEVKIQEMLTAGKLYPAIRICGMQKIYNQWIKLILKIPSNMDIHHKDHDPFNNCWDNIQILTRSEHKSIHNRRTYFRMRQLGIRNRRGFISNAELEKIEIMQYTARLLTEAARLRLRTR